MAKMWGNQDAANNAPTYQVIAHPRKYGYEATGTLVYANTTIDEFVGHTQIGVFGVGVGTVSADESTLNNPNISPGWVKKTVISGGIGTLTINYGGNTYNNTDVLTVSSTNNITNATASITTNSIGGITSYAFSNIGGGFINIAQTVVAIANSTGGAEPLTYNANVTVNAIGQGIATMTINAGGNTFPNGALLNISGGGLTVNAQANATTNSIGGITSVTIKNAGFGPTVNVAQTVVAYTFANGSAITANSTAYNANIVANSVVNEVGSLTINFGGLTYPNTAVITISGGGSTTNATANATTNATGGITSYAFSNSGVGFTNLGNTVLAIANAGGQAFVGTYAANIVVTTLDGRAGRKLYETLVAMKGGVAGNTNVIN